jgi:hypothetical protein
MINPFYIHPCSQCDHPDLCGGEYCLRKLLDEQDVLAPELVENNAPMEITNEPQSKQIKDFITTTIFR